MPNPFFPGVPALASFGTATLTTVLVNDLVAALLGQPNAQWGIFQNGVPIVVADSVISLDYRQDWTIATYPVEQGAFQSYDKVANPFDVRVRFASGGNEANRQALLDSIAAIAGTTALFDISTPEEFYPSVCISHYDYRREHRNGLGLVVVDVFAQQVRVAQTGAIVQAAPSADPQAGGAVQTAPATTAQAKVLPSLQ